MFGSRSVIVIFNKSERSLVVAKEGGRCFKGGEKLKEKSSKPQGFLCSMRCCDVFGFGCGQSYKLLLPRTPRYCAAVDKKSVAGDGMPMLLSCAICI